MEVILTVRFQIIIMIIIIISISICICSISPSIVLFQRCKEEMQRRIFFLKKHIHQSGTSSDFGLQHVPSGMREVLLSIESNVKEQYKSNQY